MNDTVCSKTSLSKDIYIVDILNSFSVPGGSIAQDGDKPCKTNACIFEASEDMESMHSYEQVLIFILNT